MLILTRLAIKLCIIWILLAALFVARLLNFPPFCTFLCRNNCNKMYNQTFFTYLTVLINSFLTANNRAKCRCVKTRSLRVTFSLHCCSSSAVMAFSHHVMHSNSRRLLNVTCSRICSRPSTSLSRPCIYGNARLLL